MEEMAEARGREGAWDAAKVSMRRYGWGPALALVVIGPMALLAALRSFDGLYGQDAYAYHAYATGPLRTSLRALEPPPPFYWPPGYPLLVALTSLVLGPVPLAGQLVSLVAGGLVPVLTALLAREVWPDRQGGGRAGWRIPALAGLLTACVGQLWQSSAVVMSDTTALAAVTLGVWALARYRRCMGMAGTSTAHTRLPASLLIALATGALAFGILARLAMMVVALPAGAYALILLVRMGRSTALRHAAVAGLVAALVLAPLWWPALETFFSSNGDAPAYRADTAIASWRPLNALRRAFSRADGFEQYRLPNALYYALAPAHRFYFTPLLALFLLPGLWAVLRRRAAPSLFLLLGWAGAVYILLAGLHWQNLRYTLSYLPPLAILAAIGLQATAARLNQTGRRLLLAVLAVSLAAMAYGGWTLTEQFIARKNADLGTVHWAAAHAPRDAHVLTFGLTLTFQHYTSLAVHDLYVLDTADLEKLAGSSVPLYLLLDVENVAHQWRDKAPETNYRWLQQHAALIPLGTRPPYSLFLVEFGGVEPLSVAAYRGCACRGNAGR